ncbi:peroxisomal membrane protein-domain-containing protein [Aspergillus bertholletiae]|uniref:Peroxisomal membrane protein-domain-containing protein n=1 Tax=Aspergillus bertholletiae TaxID=1226010 RepID=A0A5N7BAF5_9EURO|nr:peroxisomal membrane protein-domain-containing protein [Aspergillus bertholletiae]
MDILKQLHASMAQSFEKSFDDAYGDLTAVLALCDRKVAAAEERLRVTEDVRGKAVAEIERLNVEITHLREEISRNETGPDDTETSVSESQLEEAYAPQHVLSPCNDSNLSSWEYGTKEMRIVNEKYAALYEDAQTLVRGCKSLRQQARRHKRKLEHWSKCLKRDEFTLVVDGAAVKFQRVKNITNEGQDSSPTAEPIRANGMTVPPDPPLGNEDIDILSGQIYRGLKRKRGILPESGALAHCGGLSERELKPHIFVKSESISSSPARNISQHVETIETQDLDEVGGDIETPTIETSTIEMAMDAYRKSEIDPSATMHSPSAQKLMPQDDYPLSSGRRLPNGSATLQSVDSTTSLVHGSARWLEKKPTLIPKVANHAISCIAEDGEQMYPAAYSGGTSRSVDFSCPSATLSSHDVSHRLQDLLEKPLPPRPLLQSPKDNENTIDTRRHKQHESHDHETSRYNTRLPSDQMAVLDSSQTNKPPTQQQVSTNAHTSERVKSNPVEMHPEDEPYRALPLHRLELSHFRINPEHNEGLEYAFDTVVRKKKERKCIKGCTRPDCCGDQFLAMARLAGLQTDSTASFKEDDQKILEDYLGGDKYFLSGLDEEDRQKLLNEAKARLIADCFGKHRNHHQRPVTPPGFWRTNMPDTQELEFDLHSSVQLLSLYHDSLVSRVISRLPSTISRPAPTPHSRYTKYWTSHSSLYHNVAITLQMVQYTELLWEMIARRRGERVRWRVVVLIEAIKAICRLFLLRLTNSRPLVSPPLPERDVDPRSVEEEEGDWNGMQTPVSQRSSDLSWTMPRTGLSLPCLPDVNDVSNFLISKVLTADDIKPPKALLHRVTGQGQLAEILYILRPVAYALAMQRWNGNKRSWRPWLIGFGMEYGCRQLAKADFRERLAGGLRGLTGLERDELRKRGWAMGWWFMRGALYENFTKSWLKGLTRKMKGKPLLDLVGSVVEDYEYLWDNYYFSTATL